MTDTSTLPDDQQEGQEDVKGDAKAYTAVINTADWTVETILQQISKGNIELNPSFQRRGAWRAVRKSRYVESLILNIPVPQIVLAEKLDKKGNFIVIDGKQRLLTLRQFSAGKDDKAYETFSLEGLTVRDDLNGLTYENLQGDLLREDDKDALDNATIRTAVIRNWKDEEFLYTVFLRLNTGSVPLSPQELRQALHPGKFASFVEHYSSESDILHRAMGISGPDVRMRDAELVIRYFAFRNFMSEYAGSMKDILDKTSKHFNGVWDQEKADIDKQVKAFESAIQATFSIFGEKEAFRKWNGTRFEAALNRAVFDVMILYFSREHIAQAAVARKDDVVAAFKRLCEENDEFRTAVEGTTKSLQSVYNRLRYWADALSAAAQTAIPTPTLVENRVALHLD